MLINDTDVGMCKKVYSQGSEGISLEENEKLGYMGTHYGNDCARGTLKPLVIYFQPQ